MSHLNDYANNYIRTGEPPISYITNLEKPEKSYPKLEQLKILKQKQVDQYATKSFGARVLTEDIVPTLNRWVLEEVKFDVVMVGALVENHFIETLLQTLPVARLLARPGYFFVWATTKQIETLTKVLQQPNFAGKFRRLEELAFLPLNQLLPYYPHFENLSSDNTLQHTHWHCWMCITGTVRRRDHHHLIHCNVDTDLQIELTFEGGCVPEAIYKLIENFSNSTRRLHIIPTPVGSDRHVKMRRGWVMMGPDVMLDNFTSTTYLKEIKKHSQVKEAGATTGSGKQTYFLVPMTPEIETLRPKSPLLEIRR